MNKSSSIVTRLAALFLLMSFSNIVFAASPGYADTTAAYSACSVFADANGHSAGNCNYYGALGTSSVCVGDGLIGYAAQWYGMNQPFTTCGAGFKPYCSVDNQELIADGSSCVAPCTADQTLIAGVCVANCPTGKHHPTTSGGTTSATCVTDGAPMCSAVGVDVNAFVPKCSQIVTGSPSACVDADYTDFPLASCPQIDCGDGITVQYPASCPDVKTCPADFILSPLGEGLGSTCVKPAPDEQTAPCVYVGTSKVCASDPNNCVYADGQFTCLKEVQTQPPGSTCYSVAGKTYCLSGQPEVKTTETTTNNPDGTVTKQETIQPSIQGSQAQTRTTTTGADGTKTTVSTVNNDVNLAYGLSQQSQKIDLSKVELNTASTAANTKDIKDSLAGLSSTHAGYRPGVPTEGLHQDSGKTFGASMTKLKDGVLGTQIGQTLTNIFKLTIPASNCPTWTIPHTALTPEIVIDQQCAPVMDSHVWPVVRAVMYVVALLIAFTWAFL
ncbi:hypothetical protein [Methylomonas albis]|uniref:Uncharacterized protein n=1 Tax=Methylomonas albis TaxID=1854563 RepID=A0ABR9D3W5_9GAMM|nr:hypothetical protein [Methylomonas albis]MBD9357491.1 hypothetical protein [Methylomonas albis]CAD6880768.1 hypothetical protein [Methylomonas albis]